LVEIETENDDRVIDLLRKAEKELYSKSMKVDDWNDEGLTRRLYQFGENGCQEYHLDYLMFYLQEKTHNRNSNYSGMRYNENNKWRYSPSW